MEVTGRAKGGLARAQALSSQGRSEQAKKAAGERWGVLEAVKDGALKIGDIEIECAVLPNGLRVLSERAVARAFGAKRGGSHWRRKKAGAVGADLPVYLSASNLSACISVDLRAKWTAPIKYRTGGGAAGHGIEATTLPEICDVYLKARDQGLLHTSQEKMAAQADALMRSLAKVGIVALVDEATGYQEIREKFELQALLDKYLRTELAAWAKRFPDEFYEQLFRLKGWPKGEGTNRPGVVAAYTKDIIYARLAPGVLEELEAKNPIMNGRRKAKHFQWLTDDIGIPALSQHMHAVITLMRVSANWNQLMQFLDLAHPRRGDTLQLPLMSDFDSSELPLLSGLSHGVALESKTLP